MRNLVIGTLALFLSAAATAETSFLVQSRISVEGVDRASPGIALVDGKIGTVSVGEDLDLAIVASSMENSKVLVSSLLVIDGECHQPAILLELGKEGSVQMGEKKISFVVTEFSASI